MKELVYSFHFSLVQIVKLNICFTYLLASIKPLILLWGFEKYTNIVKIYGPKNSISDC